MLDLNSITFNHVRELFDFYVKQKDIPSQKNDKTCSDSDYSF